MKKREYFYYKDNQKILGEEVIFKNIKFIIERDVFNKNNKIIFENYKIPNNAIFLNEKELDLFNEEKIEKIIIKARDLIENKIDINNIYLFISAYKDNLDSNINFERHRILMQIFSSLGIEFYSPKSTTVAGIEFKTNKKSVFLEYSLKVDITKNFKEEASKFIINLINKSLEKEITKNEIEDIGKIYFDKIFTLYNNVSKKFYKIAKDKFKNKKAHYLNQWGIIVENNFKIGKKDGYYAFLITFDYNEPLIANKYHLDSVATNINQEYLHSFQKYISQFVSDDFTKQLSFIELKELLKDFYKKYENLFGSAEEGRLFKLLNSIINLPERYPQLKKILNLPINKAIEEIKNNINNIINDKKAAEEIKRKIIEFEYLIQRNPLDIYSFIFASLQLSLSSVILEKLQDALKDLLNLNPFNFEENVLKKYYPDFYKKILRIRKKYKGKVPYVFLPTSMGIRG